MNSRSWPGVPGMAAVTWRMYSPSGEKTSQAVNVPVGGSNTSRLLCTQYVPSLWQRMFQMSCSFSATSRAPSGDIWRACASSMRSYRATIISLRG